MARESGGGRERVRGEIVWVAMERMQRKSEREKGGKERRGRNGKGGGWNGRRRRKEGVQEIDVGGVTASEDKSCQG